MKLIRRLSKLSGWEWTFGQDSVSLGSMPHVFTLSLGQCFLGSTGSGVNDPTHLPKVSEPVYVSTITDVLLKTKLEMTSGVL